MQFRLENSRDFVAGQPHAPGQIGVVGVNEIFRIEHSELVKNVGADQIRAAAGNENFARSGRNRRRAGQAKNVEAVKSKILIRIIRVIQNERRGGGCAQLFRSGNQLFHAIRFEPGVVVQKQNPAAFCRARAGIVALAETEVFRIANDASRRKIGEQFSRDRHRIIRRIVVHHDRLNLIENCLRLDGFKTFRQPVRAVAVQHDDADQRLAVLAAEAFDVAFHYFKVCSGFSFATRFFSPRRVL